MDMHSHTCARTHTTNFLTLTIRATKTYNSSPSGKLRGCCVFYRLNRFIVSLQRQALYKSKVSHSLSYAVSADYVVEFEDQASKERGWEELKRVKGNKESANLPLWPYMSYRFRVIAINDVGKSAPSKPSEIHNTAAEGQSRCLGFVVASFGVTPTIYSFFLIHSPGQQPRRCSK